MRAWQRSSERSASTECDGAPSRPLDVGISLVEILVSIVLLGVAGVSVLGAMAGAVRGSSTNRSQAASVVWLQSSADYLSKVPFVPCVVGQEAQVGTSYQAALADVNAPRSQIGWAQTDLSVVQPVLFWNGATFTSACDTAFRLQQVTLGTNNVSSRFNRTLVMVKSDG